MTLSTALYKNVYRSYMFIMCVIHISFTCVQTWMSRGSSSFPQKSSSPNRNTGQSGSHSTSKIMMLDHCWWVGGAGIENIRVWLCLRLVWWSILAEYSLYLIMSPLIKWGDISFLAPLSVCLSIRPSVCPLRFRVRSISFKCLVGFSCNCTNDELICSEYVWPRSVQG